MCIKEATQFNGKKKRNTVWDASSARNNKKGRMKMFACFSSHNDYSFWALVMEIWFHPSKWWHDFDQAWQLLFCWINNCFWGGNRCFGGSPPLPLQNHECLHVSQEVKNTHYRYTSQLILFYKLIIWRGFYKLTPRENLSQWAFVCEKV